MLCTHRVPGLDGKLGSPNPRVEEAVRWEHCESSDSKKEFTTQNYGVKTTPCTEYLLVTAPDTLGEGIPREDPRLLQEHQEKTPAARGRQPKSEAEFRRLLEHFNTQLKQKAASSVGGESKGLLLLLELHCANLYVRCCKTLTPDDAHAKWLPTCTTSVPHPHCAAAAHTSCSKLATV